tara:strand:- start:457 stop:1305 length:849 start_codon:yes stop_codon:yes gene_type:complete
MGHTNPEEHTMQEIKTSKLNVTEKTNQEITAFSALREYQTLAAAQEYAKNGGYIASLPKIVEWSINDREFFSKQSVTPYSEESVGRTKYGNDVIVITHGGGILLNSKEKIKEGAKNNSQINGEISKQDFHNLLEGTLPDGSEISVCLFNELHMSAEKLPEPYGVILDLESVQKYSPRGSQQIPNLYKLERGDLQRDNLLISRVGGRKKAIDYLLQSRIGQEDDDAVWDDLGKRHNFHNSHDFEDFNGGYESTLLLRASRGGFFYHSMNMGDVRFLAAPGKKG